MVSPSLPQLVPAHEAFEAIYSQIETYAVGRRKVADVLKRLVILQDRPAPSQAQVAQGDQLQRPKRLAPDAVNKAVKALASLDLVTAQPPRRAGAGRPSIPLLLGGGRWFAIGIKISSLDTAGLCLGISCTDLGGRALTAIPYSEVRVPREHDLVAAIADRVQALLGSDELAPHTLLGVGIDVSGHVRDGSEVVLSGTDEISGRDLGAELSEALKESGDRTAARHGHGAVPVIVDNDTALLAMRETYRPQQPFRDTVVVAVFPDGVGSGAVIGNRVYRGSRGAAGEVGHISVGAELGLHREALATNLTNQDGPRGFHHPCYCDEGRFGHLDCVAPPNRIRAELGEARLSASLQHPHGRDDTTAAASRVVGAAGAALGLGLATVTNLFDPEKLLVYVPCELDGSRYPDGSVGREYLEAATAALRRHCYPGVDDGLSLEWHPISDAELRQLGARSAALRVLDSFIKHGKERCKCYVSPRTHARSQAT